MNSAITLCGQNDRRPHLTGGGNFPDAIPAHQVEGATPISLRTSDRGSSGSGGNGTCLDVIFIAWLSVVIEPLGDHIFFYKDVPEIKNVFQKSKRVFRGQFGNY